jgi:hypothetical protein
MPPTTAVLVAELTDSTRPNAETSSPGDAVSARNLNRFEVLFASRIGLPAGIA